ncbi:MAG: hypothetical protein H0X37_22425 [Herpetosiphonaceae bacterium]|nr:hypothetical protein [Herpetosiphonaceae bacterium]
MDITTLHAALALAFAFVAVTSGILFVAWYYTRAQPRVIVPLLFVVGLIAIIVIVLSISIPNSISWSIGNYESGPPIVGTGPDLFVTAPSTALDQGTGITVKTLEPHASTGLSFAIAPIGNPVQIEPTKGQLHGTATITFSYPEQLPLGITVDDLFIAAFNPDVNAWLPVPAKVDRTHRQLIVQTDHFSKWGKFAIKPPTVKESGGFVTDVSKDAALNDGDPFKAWIERSWPPPPKVKCTAESQSLLLNITNPGSPYAKIVCAQATVDPNVVDLQFANSDTYPVWVNLPTGVELEPFTEAPHEISSIEEALSQISASEAGGGFLLRGGNVVTLRVQLSRLRADAKITSHVETVSLLEDMSFWLVDMGVGSGQKDAKWGMLKTLIRTGVEKKDDVDRLTACFTKAAKALHTKYSDKSMLENSEAKSQLREEIKKTLDKCADPAGKVVTSLWRRLWNTAKQTAVDTVDVINPATMMIHRFNVLWDDPGIMNEWITGLGASLIPGNVAQITVALKVNPNPLEKVDWRQVITDLHCDGLDGPNRGVEIDEKQFADVTGDGKAEAFVAASCAPLTSSWPQRLYVFDGASDPTRPRLMATLLDYNDGTDTRGLRIGDGFGYNPAPSITIDGSTVTIVSAGYAPEDPNCCLTQQIVDTFTWTSNGFSRGKRSVVEPAKIQDVPDVINKMFDAFNKVKSYRTTLTGTSDGKVTTTFQSIIVAPDRVSIISEVPSPLSFSPSQKTYIILVGDDLYASDDGKHWTQGPADEGKSLHTQYSKGVLAIEPDLKFIPLPDGKFEGHAVGVIQIIKPAQGANGMGRGIIRYDKQTYLPLHVSIQQVVDGAIVALDQRLYDVDGFDNKVERPSSTAATTP